MKKFFFLSTLILIFIVTSLAIVLSTVGLETEKFNDLISEKIVKKNENISVKLKKIKFKFDVKNFDLFVETKNPKLIYKDSNISIENVKAYINFFSLIKSKPEIKKLEVSSKEIDISELKKIAAKTKPSNFKSLIMNKVKKGKVVLNLKLYFDNKLNLNSFIAKGFVKSFDIEIDKELKLKNTNFNFFSDSSDVLVKDINGEMNGVSIQAGNLQIKRDKETIVKSNFTTKIKLNKNNFLHYSSFIKDLKFINKETQINVNLDNFLDISFDETFKVVNFSYRNKGKIDKLFLDFDKPIQNNFLEKSINNLYLRDSKISSYFGTNKKSKIEIAGKYSFNGKDYYNFDIKNEFFNENSNISLFLEFTQKVKINFINYKNYANNVANIFLNVNKKKELININEFRYVENKNFISIKNVKISKNDLISLAEANVKTFDKGIIKNDFNISFGNKIRITGNNYDASQLNKFLNKKSKSNFLTKISKEIEIDLKNISTPLSKKLINFRLIGLFERGKFVKISSKGDFGDNNFLDISMKSNKSNKKKYLEVYSDLPQPLLSEYDFFKGLSGGILTFSSVIEEKSSTSKLIIDNFKLINAPGAVKLLSLADFGGLADLAEGDGLSFEKMEINLSNNSGLLKLDELYAVGPSISVLMEGYKENNGLTSLKGTLIPAKNLNKLLSKIPVIGKIIIPTEVGEGLFGVSFKMKGMPGKIKTTINPIKTLTPRFITKALEKSKKSK